jgi:general secretion pathway protein G
MVRQRGFTLIEMLVVVLIVGILASAAMPLAELTQRRAKEAELRSNLRTIRTAIDEYKKAWDAGKFAAKKSVEDTGYPPNLEVLVNGVEMNEVQPVGTTGSAVNTKPVKRMYLLRRLPRDPFADPLLPAARTWGLRSYESPPDAPARGADVFDVYSTSPGEGLDGIPYRQW